MGKGRKNRTFPLKENPQVPWTVNMSGSARNLTKDKLAAVVFGCKNHTIMECLDNKIFGLPASHHSYVRNVRPGLTLYLFNYTDRKLHGIFEAVSNGKMNLNPHAWATSEGVEITPYPSQVRVGKQRKCRPLLEEEFKPIIADNYYAERLFWFELDHKQNTELMKLFLASPMPEKMHRVPYATRKNDACVSFSSKVSENAVQKLKGLESEQCHGIAKAGLTANAYSSLSLSYSDSFASEKKWSELFKSSSSSCAVKEGLEYQTVGLKSSVTDSEDVENWEDRVFVTDPESDIPDPTETSSENREYSDDEGQLIPSELGSSLAEEKALADAKEIIISGTDVATLENLTHTAFQDDNNTSPVVLLTDVQSSDSQSAIVKLMQEVGMLKLSHQKQRLRIERLEHELAHSKVETNQIASPDYKPEESIFIFGGFDGCSWLSYLSLYSPSRDQVESLCPMTFTRSFSSAAKLHGELYIFGGGRDGVWYDKVESYNPINNQWVQQPCLNREKGCMAGASMYETIFAIGGNNGDECFSEVELFDIHIGSWVSSQPMLEKRSAAAAASLSGTLYVAGGYNGRGYLRSVERLDVRTHAWAKASGMNMMRGCHSLIEFNGKLYAIGGCNGNRMMSSVEVYDPRMDLWMMVEPMKASRGYFGSFVHGGKIYCIGGMQDGLTLDLAECYNEDCGWQEIGATTLGRRCLFSALVL